MSHVGEIYIGTSGWHYAHWVGPVYPAGTSPKDFLSLYAKKFQSVEINSTFYRLPSSEVLSDWRDNTPDSFVFACKASRYITHMKKLKDPEKSIAQFFKAVRILEPKLGPILFQLPPRWYVNFDRLARFLSNLPKNHRYAFEFRDESWHSDSVFKVLSSFNAAFCAFDLNGRMSCFERTADFTYVRLHGPKGSYQGQYDKRSLALWAEKFKAIREERMDVYCFFDNDERGFAALDALRLAKMVED